MTDIAALDRLIAAVEAGKLCKIPSPKRTDATARIMGYIEGYVVMRHSRYMPFLVSTNDVLSHLRAYRAKIGGAA